MDRGDSSCEGRFDYKKDSRLAVDQWVVECSIFFNPSHLGFSLVF